MRLLVFDVAHMQSVNRCANWSRIGCPGGTWPFEISASWNPTVNEVCQSQSGAYAPQGTYMYVAQKKALRLDSCRYTSGPNRNLRVDAN